MFRLHFKLLCFLLLIALAANPGFSQEESLLTLDDCISIALEQNSALKISHLSDKSAEKDVLGSYSGILPTISLSANKGNRVSGPSEYLGDVPIGQDTSGRTIYDQRLITSPRTEREFNSISLSFDQNIFDGGRWWNKNRAILLVQEAYFDLNQQIKLLEVYEIAVERSQAQVDRTEKMYELGATAQLDVFQARVNLGNDRISLLRQQNIVGQARKNLNLVMGRDPFTPVQIGTEIKLNKTLANPEELIQTAFENQPNIKQDEADIKSSKLSVSLAKGVFYPRLYGFVDYSRNNQEMDRVYTNYDKNYTVTYGIGASLNIFNGFNDYVNLQKAKIARKTTEENYEEYKRNLASEIEQYYANYQSYLDIIEINEQNLEAAKEEMRLAEERYQIGAGTSLEVREAQVNLTRAEEVLIAAQFNARIELARLNNGLGLTYKKYSE